MRCEQKEVDDLDNAESELMLADDDGDSLLCVAAAGGAVVSPCSRTHLLTDHTDSLQGAGRHIVRDS